jgi:hypothetical protein
MRVTEESFRAGERPVPASPGLASRFIPADNAARGAPGAGTPIDPEIQARELIALGPRGACSYARQRQRSARNAAIAGYWEQVARIVDDHISKFAPLDIATPKHPSAGRMLVRSPGSPDSDSGQIEEASQRLGPKVRHFHLRYFGLLADHGLDLLDEVDLEVVDQSSAILAVGDIPWPASAVGLRLLDEKGHPIFERLKSDWQIPWLS